MITVKWQLLHGGSCSNLEKLVRPSGLWKKKDFPALFSLIEHPSVGPILFDTGYAAHFFSASQSYPYRLYQLITPVTFTPEQAAIEQVQTAGYQAKEIRMIILSHLHADHIAGLKDFPQATVWVHQAAWESVRDKRGVSALRMAFLPALIPHELEDRLELIDQRKQIRLSEKFRPFTTGYDLLGDQSLLAVDLPGHAIGQIGLFLTTEQQRPVFLIADCCWTRQSYQDNQLPHRLTQLIHPDVASYRKSLQQVHQFSLLHPEVEMIPSHCAASWRDKGDGI